MKLIECKQGYYKLDNYRICEVLKPDQKGTWLDIYEAWSDDTYKFSEKCNLRCFQNADVTPIKVEKEGHRLCLA